MGVYAKNSDFRQQDKTLAYLTYPEGTAEVTPDTAALDAVILDVESEINGYIGKKYDIPLKINLPRFLTLLTIRMATYYLWNNKKASTPTDIKEDYDKSVKTLEKIGNGDITLGADSEDEDTATVPITAAIVRS